MVLTPETYRSITASVDEAIGLPNEAYTSDSFLRQEFAAVLGSGWIGIAFDDDVAAPGDLFPVQAAGQPLIVLRDRAHNIRIFHNVCRHRGTLLVDKPCSNKRQIVCPYHAWAYGLDGKLNATPNFRGPGIRERVAFAPGQQDLVEVRSAVWNHVIMVNLSGSAMPLDEWTETLDRRWSCYDLEHTLPGREVRYDIGANWKLTLENVLESYHLPVVHPGLNAYSPQDDHRVLVENRIMGQISLDYRPDDGGRGLSCFPDLPGDRQARAEYLLLFPSLMLSVTPDHYRVTLIIPESAEMTRQRWRFYFVGDDRLDPSLNAARDGVVERVDSYTREDIAILERLQAGRHSPAYDGGRFSPHHETTTHQFQKLVAQCLQAYSNKPETNTI